MKHLGHSHTDRRSKHLGPENHCISPTHSHTRTLTHVFCFCLLAAPACARVQVAQDAGALTVSTPAYTLVMDPQTAAPQRLLLKGQPVATFGEAGWWRLSFETGDPLRAADCESHVTRNGSDLQAVYTSPRAEVQLQFHFTDDGWDTRATVRPVGSAATRLALPQEVRFDPAKLNQLDFPLELGIGLKPAFFQEQAGDHPAHWSRKSIGDAGAAAVGITPTEMRDYNEPAVPVHVTPLGQQWLGAAVAGLNGWTVRTPRPPTGKPDVTLLDTPSGALLSLQKIGAGWFIRWGGVFNDQDRLRVRQISAQVAASLWQRPVEAGGSAPASAVGKPRRAVMSPVIGIISLEDTAPAAEWRAALAPIGCTFLDLHSPGEILKALQDQSCWLIVNPDEEALPTTAAGQAQMAAAIHSYLARGGCWLHTGSAPFFYILQPEAYLSIASSYPPAFSDFLQLDSAAGQVSLYGVQDPKEVLVPTQLSAAGSAQGGTLSREWITWADPGKTWTAPITRFRFGAVAPASIREYAAANGFNTTLAQKVKPALLAQLKQSLLLKYSGGSYREEARSVPLLPQPSLIHVSDYLHGGFDKQYPDHLPPNPRLGSPEEFRFFIDSVHRAGDLFMPYTNPTWWCDHPPGPTFVKEGDAPLLKNRQGKPVREAYGPNDGWALCTFHPAAIAAEKNILNGFTVDDPADVLFQDQIGARGPQYDFNPASPTPYAYNQGMIDIARRDSQTLPLGTENGYDAAMNGETFFCGICWGIVPTEHGPDWRKLWKDTYPAGTWQLAPIAQWLAHDRVLFTMHDLGQFVTNQEVLSWVLALGYHLSATTDSGAVQQQDNRQWEDFLAALQKAVGPRLDGAPLEEWEEPSPGVYRARWGTLRITANTTAAPYTAAPDLTLSAHGFYLVDAGAGLEAGWLDKYHSQDYPHGFPFVHSGSRLTVYGEEGASMLLPAVRSARLDGAAAPAPATAAGVILALPTMHPVISIPAELVNLAPQNRPHPPQTVGVIDIPGMTYGWASTTAGQWEQGLTGSLADVHLKVKPLHSWDELKAALDAPADTLAIVNPYGEHFPEPGPGRWQETLSAVRDYVSHGGSWFETSAYSFYQAFPPGPAAPDTVGPGGLAFLGYHAVDLGNTPPPVTLQVTDEGKQWLGEAFSGELGQMQAVVNRPFAPGEPAITLVTGGGAGFVAAARPAGWGWFWRLGGSDPAKTVSIPVVAAILHRLDTTPPTPPAASGKRYVYRMNVGG